MPAITASGEAGGRATRWPFVRAVGVLLLSVVSLFVPKLALIAALFAFLSFVAIRPGVWRRRASSWLTGVAGVVALAATVRFLISEAMPGLVRGGLAAAELRAVSRLREIAFAEESVRRHALFDPDRDGIGSAALLTELAGITPLPDGSRLELLNEQYHSLQHTPDGPAALLGGYLFKVCLPTRGGAFSARPGAELDREAGERRYVAYAWPADDAQGVASVYFIDERDRILSFDNREGRGLQYAGPNFPPPCAAALSPSDPGRWTAWRGKKPRPDRSGDAPR